MLTRDTLRIFTWLGGDHSIKEDAVRRRAWRRRAAPVRFLLAAAVAAVLLGVSCSQDGGGTGPEPVAVSMWGYVDFPDPTVNPEDVTIAFGDYEGTPNALGDFVIQGTQGTAGAAIAYAEDGTPMLMAIMPDPQNEAGIAINARSTALALAFLSPFVCVSNPADADEICAVLGTLPEIDDLETLLEASLAADPLALSQENTAVDSLLTRIVDAYLNAYPSLALRNYPSLSGLVDAGPDARSGTDARADCEARRSETNATGVVTGQAGQIIVIDPSNTVSGHQITWMGQDKFKITNARGRWAYCLTPQEDFYLFPNGSLLDALKRKMWAPSSREFLMDFGEISTDTAFIYVYGLGWSGEPDNVYDNLGSTEQEYVLCAGGATILFEFVPQVISVLTNTSKTFLSAEVANKNIKLLLDFFKYGKIADRTRECIRAGDYCGLVGFLAKEAISTIVNNNNFREAYLDAINLKLSDKAFESLVRWAILPARVILISDSVTSALKTVYGFVSTRFKTTFMIYEEFTEDIDVGHVQGSVHDKDTGLPIEGVTVDLLGDDDNPLHPSHQDITTSSGGYYFSNILVGEKSVRATKQGYVPATITVAVAKDQTTTGALIELDRTSGSASGRVVDEILQRNGVLDPTFAKQLAVTAREIGGEHRQYTYTVNDGDYNISLGSGSWWIVAAHDDYFPDSVQVTVAQDQEAPAPRDLVMKPKAMMEGLIYLDLNNDGTYEIQDTFTAVTAGSRRFQPDWTCPSGAPRQLLDIEGASASQEDLVVVYIDPLVLTSAGDHALGGMDVAGCSGYYPKAGAALLTKRATCYNPRYGYGGDMAFMISSVAGFAPCNCGISSYGSLTLDAYGSQLTAPIDGLMVAYLAGSTICTCTCCDDVDGDGEEDDWVVGCAKARVEVHFRVLVGSLYEGTLSPMGSPLFPLR